MREGFGFLVESMDCRGPLGQRGVLGVERRQVVDVPQQVRPAPLLGATWIRKPSRSNLASAAHMNTVLPALIRDLRATGRLTRLQLIDAASVSWTRQQLNVRKTHCYDAALQGQDFQTIKSLPNQVLAITPAFLSNGRSKQKANVDRHGTPVGRPFRNQQKLPRHLRQHRPAAGHSDRHQRYGNLNIGTGDTIVLEHKAGRPIGRAVIKVRGTRIAVGQHSAKIANARIIARNPRHRIRWTAPSQQRHHDPGAVTLSAVADT